MQTFTSKNYTWENFDAIRIQRRISASFPVKISWIYLPKFTSKEKSGGYSVYCYSRVASIERALKPEKRRTSSDCPRGCFVNCNLPSGMWLAKTCKKWHLMQQIGLKFSRFRRLWSTNRPLGHHKLCVTWPIVLYSVIAWLTPTIAIRC